MLMKVVSDLPLSMKGLSATFIYSHQKLRGVRNWNSTKYVIINKNLASHYLGKRTLQHR